MNKFAKVILNATNCSVCPRNCNANRQTQLGFCKAPNEMKVAKIMVHEWEEPYLTNICSKTGPKGSGAIFFSGCNLRCVYCQNFQISRVVLGKTITPQNLVDIFKMFEEKNVCNINLVTPTHFVKEIIKALSIYKPSLPIIYNTSGYENEQTIKALKGLVDIFLFDFKYYAPILAKEYSFAPDYPEICKKALICAKKQVKNDVFVNGIMQKGIVVRYLLLPNTAKDGIEILDFIYKNLGKNTFVSILNQYAPTPNVALHPILKNRPKKLEYKLLISHAKKLNMPNVFIQDEDSSSSSFIPDFNVYCDF